MLMRCKKYVNFFIIIVPAPYGVFGLTMANKYGISYSFDTVSIASFVCYDLYFRDITIFLRTYVLIIVFIPSVILKPNMNCLNSILEFK